MMYGYDDAGWGWMVVMLLVLVAFSAGVAALVVMLRRNAHPALPALPSSGSPRASNAHTILDERLARGEIDAAEHRERRAALNE